MAYTLNTSHALYANLVELIGVQGGALVSHKTARTFTKHAEATYGSGAWGEHFTSLNGGYTAKGAAFTPAITMSTVTYPNYTVLAVFNATGTSSGGGVLAKAAGGATIRGPGKDASGNMTGYRCTGGAIGTGQRMLTFCRIGETAAKLYNNNVQDLNATGLGPDYNDPSNAADYLLGWDGQSAIGASIVWLAIFNRELTQAEVSDLYASIGASNSFGLVGSAAPTANFAVTPSNTVFAGSATGLATATSFSVTTAASTFSGGAVGQLPLGVITTQALKNNSGTLLANETGVKVHVYNEATGAHVVTKTGLTTNASGICTLSDASIVAGSTYRFVIILASTAEGMDKAVAT